MPCTMRNAISEIIFHASPHSAEPTRKIPIPNSRTGFLPVEVGQTPVNRNQNCLRQQVSAENPAEEIDAAQRADNRRHGRFATIVPSMAAMKMWTAPPRTPTGDVAPARCSLCDLQKVALESSANGYRRLWQYPSLSRIGPDCIAPGVGKNGQVFSEIVFVAAFYKSNERFVCLIGSAAVTCPASVLCPSFSREHRTTERCGFIFWLHTRDDCDITNRLLMSPARHFISVL